MHRRPFIAALLLAVGLAPAHPGRHPDPSAPGHADAPLEASAAYLQARLAEQPGSVILLSKLAGVRLNIARSSGSHADFAAAADAMTAWLEARPASVDAHIGLCHALLGRHRFEQAIGAAQRAVLADPSSDAALSALADARLAAGDYAEAALIAGVLAERTIRLETLARVGVIAWELGRLDEADTAMTEAVHAGELLGAATDRLAWCFTVRGDIARDRGDAESARAMYRRAIELDENAREAQRGLALLSTDAAGLSHGIDALSAQHEKLRAPADAIALHRLLRRRGGPGDGERALSLLAETEGTLRAEIAAGNTEHARQLILVWLEAGTNAEGAARLAAAEVDVGRHDAEAFELAAWTALRAGRAGEAEAHARRAVSVCGQRPRPLLRCGLVLAAAGREAAAVACLRAGLSRAGALHDEVLVADARRVLDRSGADGAAARDEPTLIP